LFLLETKLILSTVFFIIHETQSKEICVRQNDGVSCGNFVLMNLRRLFRGEPTDLLICPVDARAQLLRDILEHNTLLQSLLLTSYLGLLSKV
jgi:Ulp1 family protease